MKPILKLIVLTSLFFIVIGCQEDKSSSTDTKSSNIQVMTKEDLWDKLFGYWTNNNTDFVVFAKDGDLGINFGTWYSETGRDNATITKYLVNSETNYTITIKFSKQGETLMNGPYEELTMNLEIDISEIESNRITIKSDNGVVIYSFSGRTYQQALDSIEN